MNEKILVLKKLGLLKNVKQKKQIIQSQRNWMIYQTIQKFALRH